MKNQQTQKGLSQQYSTNVNPKSISGHQFQTFLNNFSFTSAETNQNNRSLILDLKQNQFVTYKDQGRRIIQLKKKIPSSTYANTIQTNNPIDIRQEIFYFEIKIINCGTRNQVLIGFSDKDFQQSKLLGTLKRSYAYKADGKIFNQKATGDEYGPKYERGDTVGCGLIIPAKKIFFTFNGRLLGTAFSNVEIIKDGMFPSVCLQCVNEEVQANFSGISYSGGGAGGSNISGALGESFLFDIEGYRQDFAFGEFMDISRVQVKRSSLFDLVKSYLIHYAYVETLQSLEEESSADITSLQVCASTLNEQTIKQEYQQQQQLSSIIDANEEQKEASPEQKRRESKSQCQQQEQQQQLQKEEEQQIINELIKAVSESKITDDQEKVAAATAKLEVKSEQEELLGRQISAMSDVSAEEYANNLMQRTARSESVNIFEGQSEFGLIGGGMGVVGAGGRGGGLLFETKLKMNRSGSMYIPPRISDHVLEKSEKYIKADSALYLKDRGILRYMLHQGELEEARKLLQTSPYQILYQNNIKVKAYLDALTFIQLISDKNLEEALNFAENQLKMYREVPYKVYLPTKNKKGEETEIDLVSITALICYQDPEQSEYAFLLSEGQRQIIASLLNNELLRFGNKNFRKGQAESNLERMFKQLILCQNYWFKKNNEGGKQFRLRVQNQQSLYYQQMF